MSIHWLVHLFLLQPNAASCNRKQCETVHRNIAILQSIAKICLAKHSCFISWLYKYNTYCTSTPTSTSTTQSYYLRWSIYLPQRRAHKTPDVHKERRGWSPPPSSEYCLLLLIIIIADHLAQCNAHIGLESIRATCFKSSLSLAGFGRVQVAEQEKWRRVLSWKLENLVTFVKLCFLRTPSGSSQPVSVCSPISLGDLQRSVELPLNQADHPDCNPFIWDAHYKDDHVSYLIPWQMIMKS